MGAYGLLLQIINAIGLLIQIIILEPMMNVKRRLLQKNKDLLYELRYGKKLTKDDE